MKIYGNACKQVVFRDWEDEKRKFSMPMSLSELKLIGEMTTEQKIDEIVYNNKAYQPKYRIDINSGEDYIYINADVIVKYEYEDDERNKKEITKEEAYKLIDEE